MNGTTRLGLALVGAVCLASWVVGCGGRGLPEVPEPAGLADMGPAVQEQYQVRRGALDVALASSTSDAQAVGEAYGEMGLWFQVYGLSEGAEVSYRNARALAPEASRWAYYLGMLFAGSGRSDEARQQFEDYLRMRPKDVPGRVRMAELELTAGRIDEAERWLQEALSEDPDCARALFGLASVAEARGDDAAALDWLQKAVTLRPSSSQIRYALALAYRRLGDTERAAALAVFAEPQSQPDVYIPDPLADRLRDLDVGLPGNLRRARQAAKEGSQENALRFFQRAVRADPRSVPARIGLARSLFTLGRVEASRQELTAALQIAPHDAQVHSTLGAHLARLGQRDGARDHFLKALEADAESRPALRGLGDLLAAEGDVQGAWEHYARARTLGLTVELVERHALALIRLERYAEARQALEDDLPRVAAERRLELLQARLLATAPVPAARDGARALELARAAFTASPGFDAAEVLVMALAESGQRSAAVAGQKALVAAARGAGRDELLRRLEGDLAQLQRGQPLRDALPSDAALAAIFVDPATFE